MDKKERKKKQKLELFQALQGYSLNLAFTENSPISYLCKESLKCISGVHICAHMCMCSRMHMCKHVEGRDRNSVCVRSLCLSRKSGVGYTGEDGHPLVSSYWDHKLHVKPPNNTWLITNQSLGIHTGKIM